MPPHRLGDLPRGSAFADYARIVVAYRNGAPVKLSDVADIVQQPENLRQAAWMNEAPAVIINIQWQPGANIISVVDQIKKLLPQLTSTLPASVHVAVLTDRTNTIRASVDDVEFELMLTVALVVMVIFIFLRNVPATIIPSVAVPLSLIGTFAVMYLLGYSLNNLTLMALTTSTGFVVDDAIVMIENIDRFIEEGETPMRAALRGAEQIGFTIISLTVSLIAVLRPDIARAERQTAAENEQIGVAKAASFPTLTLTATGGFQSTSVADWLTWPSRFWTADPQLAEVLFSGGRRRAQLDLQRAAYDAAASNYRQVALTAFQQVEDNLAALRILKQEGKAQDQAVRDAEDTLAIATDQYKAGITNYLQVITAQTTALQNQRAAIDVLTRRMAASVLLVEALGGGWQVSQLPH